MTSKKNADVTLHVNVNVNSHVNLNIWFLCYERDMHTYGRTYAYTGTTLR